MIVFLFFNIIAYAQSGMFIGQLSDRLVTRENFDKKGSLINKQSFQVGEIKESGGEYEVEVLTELFDESGKSTGKYRSYYKCKPNESSVMVMAFPFSKVKSKETKLHTSSPNFKELYNLNTLENVELEIAFDSGLLDFFGSKSRIKIYDRVLEQFKNSKKIKSKLNVKAYALGIRFKQLKYSVIEKLSNQGLLLFQEFKEEDGSYFTMTYKTIDHEK